MACPRPAPDAATTDAEDGEPLPEGPGHQALRGARASEAGQWYAIATRAAVPDLRPVSSVIIEEGRRLDDEGAIRLHAIVAMPDHIHLLVTLLGDTTLDRAMKLLKGRSSRRANERLQRTGSLWQPAYYDRRLRDPREAYAQWGYILENPIQRGLVDDWRDYPHCFTTPFAA